MTRGGDRHAADCSASAAAGGWQHTLGSSVECTGVGLHSGARVRLTLMPAAAGGGIRFRLAGGIEIPATHAQVVDTRLCTVLGQTGPGDTGPGQTGPGAPGARVGTVEHLMAALSASGIDNAVIAVDGPEVPVLDGSAAPFLFLIGSAGRVAQPATRTAIEILAPVRVQDGPAFAELRPGCGAVLEMAMSIDFPAAAIGRQALTLSLTERNFREVLAPARTFTLASDIARLQAAGLARGGSLDNAVVVDGARVLNPGGLRAPDEFVRHKLLDAVGDLALAGAPLRGRFVAHRSGHALNHRLLCALFADPCAWRPVAMARWALAA